MQGGKPTPTAGRRAEKRRDDFCAGRKAGELHWAQTGGTLPYGCGSKLDHQGTTGVSPWFYLPGFHFGYPFTAIRCPFTDSFLGEGSNLRTKIDVQKKGCPYSLGVGTRFTVFLKGNHEHRSHVGGCNHEKDERPAALFGVSP